MPLTCVSSAFCHASECPGRAALVPGSKVSFTFEADEKSGKARDVQIEEVATEPKKRPREKGTIKVLPHRHERLLSSTLRAYTNRDMLHRIGMRIKGSASLAVNPASLSKSRR